MQVGNFYFLTDEYFDKFDDDKLMGNKESIDGEVHDRPCFYAFKDNKTSIYWLIPFSSKVDKYKRVYQNKVKKYGKCDTIMFGNVLGHEKAFLIQNMCPVSIKYIKNEYKDAGTNKSVKIDGVFEKKLIKNAKKTLALYKQGKPVIFVNVAKIEKELIKEISMN